jgi:hypothetical protein
MALTLGSTDGFVYFVVSGASALEAFQYLEDLGAAPHNIVSHVYDGTEHVITYSKKNSQR